MRAEIKTYWFTCILTKTNTKKRIVLFIDLRKKSAYNDRKKGVRLHPSSPLNRFNPKDNIGPLEASSGAATSKNKLYLPTWSTLATAPCSRRRSPWQNGEFWYSSGLARLPQGEEYIRISRSSRGKAQKTSRSCTGSGIRGYRSSIRWKGRVLATNLAAMSRRLGADRRTGSRRPWW